jgi:hypothetical protein
VLRYVVFGVALDFVPTTVTNGQEPADIAIELWEGQEPGGEVRRTSVTSLLADDHPDGRGRLSPSPLSSIEAVEAESAADIAASLDRRIGQLV